MTLYLIDSNVYGAVHAPPSRGFSFIEIWYLGVQLIIIMAMIEYAIILALSRVSSGKKAKKTSVVSVGGVKNGTRKVTKDSYDIERLVKWMDKGTMIASATIFIIFNVCYWIAAHKAHYS